VDGQHAIGPEGNGAGGPLQPPTESAPSEERAAQARFLWEHRGTLLRAVVLGLAVSTAIAFLIPVRFTALTQLMPPDSPSGPGMALLSAISGRTGGLGAVAGDLLGVKNSGAVFVGVLQSQTVRNRLVEQFGLKQAYRASKIEDARQSLSDHTDIAEDRKSGIISITVTDHDPNRAAAMARAYVTELDRLVAQVSTSSARRERIFLEERLTAVKQDLNNAATKFSEFASKNTAIDIPAQGRAMIVSAATLQGQLIFAESELRGLEAIYTDQNVRVRSLRARVTELRTQLGKIGGDSGSAGALSAKNDPSLYPSIRQLPLLGVTYADLYRQTKIEETVFELLTQQYELAKVQEAKEIPSVKVLDPATVPTKKSFPPRLIVMLAGTVFAVLAVCAWLFARRSYTAIDSQDPGKLLAEEVARTFKNGIVSAAAMFKGLSRDHSDVSEPAARELLVTADKSSEKVPTDDQLSRAARRGAL
jgi:capsule polysaccharide export protein KpsE/RkpR